MECQGSEESEFRETLIAILQKPFDITEYEALWRDASQQKPMQGARELRGRTVVFPVDSDTASYLDQHDSEFINMHSFSQALLLLIFSTYQVSFMIDI